MSGLEVFFEFIRIFRKNYWLTLILSAIGIKTVIFYLPSLESLFISFLLSNTLNSHFNEIFNVPLTLIKSFAFGKILQHFISIIGKVIESSNIVIADLLSLLIGLIRVSLLYYFYMFCMQS